MRLILALGALIMWSQVMASPLRKGVYKVSVAFAQGQEFVDYLNVNDKENGVFTVPGSFTSRVKLVTSGDDFSFILKAKEGNTDILLNFKGSTMKNGTELKGEIVEPDSNQTIGKFKGAKLYESEQDCGDYLIPY